MSGRRARCLRHILLFLDDYLQKLFERGEVDVDFPVLRYTEGELGCPPTIFYGQPLVSSRAGISKRFVHPSIGTKDIAKFTQTLTTYIPKNK